MIDAEDDQASERSLGTLAWATSNVREKKMSSTEVVRNSIAFLFAGADTTSSTLAFVTLLLAMNDDKQRHMIEEIDAFCGHDEEVV
jgi:cytochrome P450